jgi:hypothetical protein
VTLTTPLITVPLPEGCEQSTVIVWCGPLLRGG